MKRRSLMLIAGEPSGDVLASELIRALREEFARCRNPGFEPRIFGAGGPNMAASGAELAFDMTEHSVIGLLEVVKNLLKYRRLFNQLYRMALDRQPDAIIGVDYSGFNRRFGHAIKRQVRSTAGSFKNWNPKLIQYVSPQVWASRPGRAHRMAADYDLVLSIIPFEKEWYAKHVPSLTVEFVGNPVIDRHRSIAAGSLGHDTSGLPGFAAPRLLLLPGSRQGELHLHLPPILGALQIIRSKLPGASARLVLPDGKLLKVAEEFVTPGELVTQCGGLTQAMESSDLAIASTGTVTLECACSGLPTVTLYKTSWSTYQIAKRIIKVKYLAMPNLLADAPLFPELIQDNATAENISAAALSILSSPARIAEIKNRLAQLVGTLGPPGASRRAAGAIARLLED